ncbi:MAG TPA: hypothetical protein VJP40_01515 [bacterium]|nr:hypothetical protein [bacterium]
MSNSELDDGLTERSGESSEEILPPVEGPSVPFGTPTEDTRSQPTADASQPSVFSSQVGVVNNPTIVEILCDIFIDVPMEDFANFHDEPCPAPIGIVASNPPYANLREADEEFLEVNEEILLVAPAECNQKDPENPYWDLTIYIDSYSFLYTREEVPEQIPNYFMLEIFTFHEGAWQPMAFYPLEIYCTETDLP